MLQQGQTRSFIPKVVTVAAKAIFEDLAKKACFGN